MSINNKTYAEIKKGGFMQQKQNNYFSMRLKSIGGHFTTAQLDTIKKVADEFGSGYIHLTSRQGIEIPFIHFDDIEAVKEFLANGGVEIGVCGPRVRTITACQGGQICSSGLIDTVEIAKKIDSRYGGVELPHKFKFGITGCHNNCLKAEENDVGIKGGVIPIWKQERCIFCGGCAKICPANAIIVDRPAKTWHFDIDKCLNCGKCLKRCNAALSGKKGFLIYFGGRYGNEISVGRKLFPLIRDEDNLFEIVDSTITFFQNNAKRGERFAKTIERVGLDFFLKQIS